jgi:carbon-monoxide dehydrogenase medium subunit
MKPARFSYHAPRSVDDAIALLGELAAEDGRILAGGQSLVPTMAFRVAQPGHLIDINGIESLGTVHVAKDRLRIGACVRHAAFEGKTTIPGPTGALLGTVVHNIAHYPIRVRGTFCGSLAHADPSSEWCCTVAALDGQMIVRSRRGERAIAAANYFQGVMSTALEDDEMLTAVELPLLSADTRCGFQEFSRRPGDFAIAMVLATYRLEGGRIADPRIAVGGAEVLPRRIAGAEAALAGQRAETKSFARAAEAAAEAIEPMEDNFNTAAYRRALVLTLAQRALEKAR